MNCSGGLFLEAARYRAGVSRTAEDLASCDCWAVTDVTQTAPTVNRPDFFKRFHQREAPTLDTEVVRIYDEPTFFE